MTMQDPIADMLTRIRNGQLTGRTEVRMPSSKMKCSIAKVLKEEGYIADYRSETVDGKQQLTVALKYHGGKPVIEKIRRASRPGLRRYASKGKVPQVIGGLGIAIVSTSQGLMTDRAARRLGIGGEIICTVS